MDTIKIDNCQIKIDNIAYFELVWDSLDYDIFEICSTNGAIFCYKERNANASRIIRELRKIFASKNVNFFNIGAYFIVGNKIEKVEEVVEDNFHRLIIHFKGIPHKIPKKIIIPWTSKKIKDIYMSRIKK